MKVVFLILIILIILGTSMLIFQKRSRDDDVNKKTIVPQARSRLNPKNSMDKHAHNSVQYFPEFVIAYP